MNKNPCSNQEIHVLFEHGFELENTKMSPALFARRYIRKALRTILIISPMFLFAKTLCMVMMTFESLQPTPFSLEKSSVRNGQFNVLAAFSVRIGLE